MSTPVILSPGQGACATARGNSTAPAQTSPVALRLPGLQVHHRLPFCRPGKAPAPRPGEITLRQLRLPPVALRLPGLQVHRRLPFCSPGKALAPRPGEIAPRPLRLPPVALRLPGLQVHRRLPFCSPGKALAPRPGEIAPRPLRLPRSRCAYRGYNSMRFLRHAQQPFLRGRQAAGGFRRQPALLILLRGIRPVDI